MSIRVTSSGHNFSQHTPIAEGEVTLLIESSKAMLLPTSQLEEKSPQEHLLSAGIATSPLKEVVLTIRHDDIMSALIAIPATLQLDIYSTYEERANITTPLLADAPSRDNSVLVHLSKDKTLMCIKIFRSGALNFAELFDIKSSTDVLYWLSRLGEGYDLNKYTIHIDGGDKNLKDFLHGYYKRVTLCE